MCSLPAEQEQKTERLFFALWPEENLRRQLHRHCKSLLRHAGGKPVPIENLHITLAFLGNVDVQQRRCIEAMADETHCPAFDLTLDRVGHWFRSRVLWLAPTHIPEALTTLAADLHAGATACGLKMDARPYRAHLTLKRKLARAPQVLDFQALDWPVRHFVLARSVTYAQGAEYEVIREWPLAVAAD